MKSVSRNGCKQLRGCVTFCEPSVPRNKKNRKTRTLWCWCVQFCVFLVRRHWRVPLIKEITNLRIGVFHVFSSEQMATQPIVPRVCPANFLKPLGRVYTGSTGCFGGTCITNKNRARQKLCENEPDLWSDAAVTRGSVGLVWTSWASPHVPERLHCYFPGEVFKGCFCSTITKFHDLFSTTRWDSCVKKKKKRDDREARMTHRFSLLKWNSHQNATKAFFCECTRVKPSYKSIITTKEAHRFTAFSFSVQTHFQWEC